MLRRFFLRALVAPAISSVPIGCRTLGWSFGPGAASTNRALFEAPPVVERAGRDTYLTWTYGSAGFYFTPSYDVVDGRLVFSLQGSSSSGQLTGRPGRIRIDRPDALRALAENGAYWWEPDERFTRLEVRTTPLTALG